MLPNEDQIAKLAESPYVMVDLLENSEEMEVYAQAKSALDDADGVTKILAGTDVMDDEIISAIESKFPGFVLDNIPFEIRYSTEGHEAATQQASELQKRMLTATATATAVMVQKFSGFMGTLTKSNVSEGVVSTLTTLKQAKNSLPSTTSVTDESKLQKAYQDFMGVKAESVDQIIEMIQLIKEADSPLECLKKYPNDKYNKLFTPLLASTVAESSNIFQCFAKLNDVYARQLGNSIDKMISDLDKIYQSKDYSGLVRYQGNFISEELMGTITELVSSLDADLDHRKGLLKQTRTISQHAARMLKVNDDSLRKKASVVNAIIYRYKDLDKAFKDISEATQKLSEYTKSKSENMKRVQHELIMMKANRRSTQRAKETFRGEKYAQSHNRIITEFEDVWVLIDLMVRLCISFSTNYSILKITLDKFKVNFAKFAKAVGGITEKEGELESDDEKTSTDKESEEDIDTPDEEDEE